MTKRIEIILVSVILFCFLYLASAYLFYASPNGDEVLHLGAGIVKLKTGDFTIGAYQPPLVQLLAALPSLTTKINIPFEDWSWRENVWEKFCPKLLYQSSNPTSYLFIAGRLMILLFSTLGVVSIWYIIRLWFGAEIALVNLLGFCFSTNILTRASYISGDLISAICIFWAIAGFDWFRHKPGWTRMVLVGVLLGVAQLTKHFALILFPAIFLYFLLFKIAEWSLLKKFYGFVMVITISMVTIWAGYGFEMRPILAHVPDYYGKVIYIQARFGNHSTAIVHFLRNVSIPAKSYLMTFPNTFKRAQTIDGAENLNQKTSYLYPLVFKSKEPVGFVLLIITGLLVIAHRLRYKTFRRDERLLLFGIPFGLLLLLYWMNQTRYGIIHLLPLYPFFFLLAAYGGRWMLDKVLFGKALAVIFLTLYLLAPFTVFPNYMNYFNLSSGGPAHGFRILEPLVDEEALINNPNLDWGQNFYQLSRYLYQTKPRHFWVEENYVSPYAELFSYLGLSYQIYSCHKVPSEIGSGDLAMLSILQYAHLADRKNWKVRKVIGSSIVLMEKQITNDQLLNEDNY